VQCPLCQSPLPPLPPLSPLSPLSPARQRMLARDRAAPLQALSGSLITEGDYLTLLPPPMDPSAQMKVLRIIDGVQRKYELIPLEANMTNRQILLLAHIRWKTKLLQKHVLRSNLRLVYGVALRYENMGLCMNDLILEGFKGLQRALQKYDVHKGYAFSTYAYPWIAEHIRNALAQSLPISLPHNVHRLLMRVQSVRSRLFLTQGRSPSDEELRAEMHLSGERFEVVRRAISLAERSSDPNPDSSWDPSEDRTEQGRTALGFDEATWERVESTYGEANKIELVQSPLQEEGGDAAHAASVRSTLLSALQILPLQEAAAIRRRLGLGFNGASEDKEWEAQMYHKGLRRLRRRLAVSDASDRYPEVSALSEDLYASN